MVNRTHNAAGFTLIELILALALFSFVLLIVTIGLIQIIHLYQSGLAARNAQANSRTAFEEISRLSRDVSSVQVIGAGDIMAVCLFPISPTTDSLGL